MDLGAHLAEADGEVADLRLAGGILDDGLAAGECGRHQRRMGGADRHFREGDAVAAQSLAGRRDDIAAIELDVGAELLQRKEVQVDRAGADGAAAGQRDARLPAAGESGPSTQKLARMRDTSS